MATSPDAPRDWKRVSQLVADALELPSEERAAWLATACAGDEGLHREVASLVAAEAHAGSFLQRSALASTGAADLIASSARESLALVAGRRIGPYQIIRELGHGGMGVVYLAARADLAFEKQVAVKVVRGGAASALALQRFADERRILATLEHPHIARLLDGGVTHDGLSYLVMEYVDGVPLDVYCHERRVSLPERLRLFRDVASAVEYAHQRLVIHRDIKPGNILVTSDGAPKLLDFGIARLLDQNLSAGRTSTGLRAFTLEHASPEQIRGEPMAVTSDVYSLGGLLYQLMTGQRPYGVSAQTDADLMRAICEEPPVRPVIAARTGTGFTVSTELEWIVLKALRKEPDRRYESVARLLDDLDRLASGRPVLAGPDSRRYRARKFLSRHRTAVAAGALLALSIVAGITTTVWQARRANQRFDDVRQLAHTFIFDIHDAVEKLPGSTAARQLLVTNALTYLDRLASEAESDASLQRELATSYEKMADVLGLPNRPNLGDLNGAIAAYRKAQAARQRLLTTDASNPELRRDLAATSSKLARALMSAGEMPAGLEEAQKAARIEESLVAHDATDAARLRLAASYTAEGFLLAANSRTREGVEQLRQAIAILESLPPGENDIVARQLGVTYSDLGRVLCEGTPVEGLVPDADACIEAYKKSNAIEEPLARANPSNAALQRSVFVGTIQIGEALVSAGQRLASIDYFRRSCAAGARLAALDTVNLQARSDAALACVRLGESLAVTGGAAEALGVLQRSVGTLEGLAAADPGNLGTQARIADANVGLGRAHAALGADPGLARDVRTGHWRDAKAGFRAGQVFWTDMRNKGVVNGAEANAPEQLATEIAKCDAALAVLH